MKFNLSKAEFALSAGRENQFPRDGRPQIAMSGRSNVGKSSLINTVLGRKKLARTSSEPGKTITVNFYDIDKKFYRRVKDYVIEFPVEKVETNYKNMILSDLANVYRIEDSKFVSALYSLMFSKYSYQAGFICNLILTGKLANIKLAKKLFILSVKRR